MIDQFVLKIGNINIPQKQVAQGLSMIDALDETLDTATVIIAPAKRQEVFPMWENVWLTIDGTTRSYMVSEDSVDMLSKQPVLFKHTVQLIEPTKYLDVLPCDNLTFTKPSNQLSYPDDLEGKNASLWHVLRRIRMCAQLRLENATEPFPFEIDPAVESELKSIEAPQFFLNVGNIRDAVNQVFKYINAVARCWIAEDGTLMLAYDRFNKRNNLIPDEHVDITKGYITNYGASQSIQDYASEVQTYVSNLTTDSENADQAVIVYPAEGNWASLRSENGGILTTSNMRMITPSPISKVEKLTLWLEVRYYPEGSFYEDKIVSFDVTPLVVTKEVYDTLERETEWGVKDIGDGKTIFYPIALGKDAAIIYEYLGTNFYGLDETWSGFMGLSRTVIDTVSSYVYWNANGTASLLSLPTSGKVNFSPSLKCLWNVIYMGTTDSRLSSEKDESTTRKATINVNQATNLTDNIALGQNMQGLVQRLGQDEKLYTVRFKKYQNVWNIGDYTSDGYIVTKRGISIYNDFVIGNMTLNKNFNRRSQFVDLDSEIRQFVIPAKENSLTRHSLIKQYVYFSTKAESGEGSNFVGLYTGMMASLCNFSNTVGWQYNPNAAWYECAEINNYLRGAIDSKSFGNSIAFTFGFNDNRSAGNRVYEEDKNKVEQAVAYTINGGLQKLQVKLANTFNVSSDFDALISTANRYPICGNSSALQNIAIICPDNLMLYKDPAEIWRCTIQFHFLADPTDENELIIGEGYATNHFWVRPWRDRKLAVYALWKGEKYQPYETQKVRGLYLGDMPTSANSSSAFFVRYNINNLTSSLLPSQSWCIGDKETGEMYLACNPNINNEETIKIINLAYFNAKK